MHFNKLYSVVLMFAWTEAALGAITQVDLQLEARHDNNICRGETANDIFHDNITDFGVEITNDSSLTPNSGLRFIGGLRLSEHIEYPDLDLLTANIGAKYQIQPTVGYLEPWFELGTTLVRESYRDSNIRNGLLFDADTSVNKRFTDRIGASAGLGWERRWADDAKIFEWEHCKLFTKAYYMLGPAMAVYASFSRAFGDQVFTVTPDPEFFEYAKAASNDSVFGARKAYRLGAISNTLELGISAPMNSSNTLDASLRHFHANADAGHEYKDVEVRVSWIYRFR